MHIWLDADACPGSVKDILYRAAERSQIAMTLVANKPLQAPRPPFTRSLQTGGPAGLDQTDRKRFADQLDRFLARLPRR